MEVEKSNDVVEEIFLRLPIKSVLRFKCLSKPWKSAIESRYFAERHSKLLMTKRRDEDDEHQKLLMVSRARKLSNFGFRMMSFDSPNKTIDLFNFPQLEQCGEVSDCCNGLICTYNSTEPFIYVVNPITCFFRQLPPARFQVLIHKVHVDCSWQSLKDIKPITRLAFGKTELHGYKLVWLYNSNRYNSDVLSPDNGTTKCEIFDFKSNTWRYLVSTPKYPIFDDQKPVFIDESVYWVTERDNNRETKVIVLDLRTETFRLMSKIPVSSSHPDHIDMCNLNGRLCISKRLSRRMKQVIWIYESLDDTWTKIYSIDLFSCTSWLGYGTGLSWTRRDVFRPSTPLGICTDKKILLSHRYADNLFKYDPKTKPSLLFHKNTYSQRVVSYFPTLISHV